MVKSNTLDAVLVAVQSVADQQKALEDMIVKAGQPAYAAAGLMAKGGRIEYDPQTGYTPIGRRWHKGIGMGAFLMGLMKTMTSPNAPESEAIMKALGSTKAALAETSGVTGGYTVPVEFSARLLMLAFEDAIALPLATVIPMTSRTILLPSLDVTTRYSAGQTPFLGGVVATWTEEAQLLTETEPQFRQTELVARELSGYTVASNTLLQDNAVGLDALLSQLFTYAISWYSDYAFIQGNGVGKPLGVLNSPATAFVTAASAGALALADVVGMFATLTPQSYNSAVWVISPSEIPQLLQLKDGANHNIFFPTLTTPSDGGPVQQQVVWKLLGRPVFVTEKMPLRTSTSGATRGIMLVDWPLYLIGMRMEIEVAVSPHFKFTNNQMVWRFVARMDGRPWLDNTIRLQDGTTVYSPFVGLVNP